MTPPSDRTFAHRAIAPFNERSIVATLLVLAVGLVMGTGIAGGDGGVPQGNSVTRGAGGGVGHQARVLFIRGADRSGGFLEAGNDNARTEQLSDIDNQQTSGGNHGWFQLAQALREDGFVVEQMLEPLEPASPPTGQTTGSPIAFDQLNLTPYRVIVLGSNNADYSQSPGAVDAIEAFVRSGGGLLVIADANFGSDWPDSPTSDQPFLDRFGWIMQQDRGTYSLTRDEGDFLAPLHPLLVGVNQIDGEGVSPIVVPDAASAVPGVFTTLVVRAKPGRQTRNNDSTSGQGSSRQVGTRDAAVAVAFVGDGRLVGHFDRNTFFNQNGAGTNINRFDNRVYAINLFRFLAFGPADADSQQGLSVEDIYAVPEGQVDVNGDGVFTPDDIQTTENLVRRNELANMAGRQR